MTEPSIREIGERLAMAGRLKARPLCIYGAEAPPKNAVPMTESNRCAARAIFHTSMNKDAPPIFLGEGQREGCCPGGLTYFGFTERHPMLKFFLSYGSSDFRGGAAEFLRMTPELAEESFQASGLITKLGRYLIVSPSEDIDGDPGVRSFLLFGGSESVRNLCSLVHFRSVGIFSSVIAPAGASCASFVTYAAGMAEKAPKDTVFIGPLDPTGNSWFPRDHLSLAVPVRTARSMALDLEHSFIAKRANVAYPKKRISP